jgi:hypothetical protein
MCLCGYLSHPPSVREYIGSVERISIENMSTSLFECPLGLELFEKLYVAMKADSPTTRSILLQCTKVKTSNCKFDQLRRKISRHTNSRIIINFMSDHWSEIKKISGTDKALIADSLKSIEKERVDKLSACDHYYD